MTELEIREKIMNLQDELESIITTGESESRELSEEENSKMVDLRSQIDDAKAELAKIEEENRKLNSNNKVKTNNKMEKEIRLFDLVKEIANGNVPEEHRQFVNGNSINFRAAIQATATGHGEEDVPEFKAPLEIAVRNASVLDKIGATFFSDARGDISIPLYSGSNCKWSTSENSEAEDGAGEFSEIVLQPKRLTAVLDVSNQFLAQTSPDTENLLLADISRSIAEALDKQLFSSDSGATNRPAGLFSGDYISSGTLADATYESVLALETEVEEKNSQNYIFVTTPGVKQNFRGVQLGTGLGMVYDNGELDGRKAVVSNSVEKGGLLTLEPKDLVAAFWSDQTTLIVDNYTRAPFNQVRIVVNFLVDAKMKSDRIAGVIFE